MDKYYSSEGLSRKDLIFEVDKIWKQLQEDASVRDQARQLGIEPNELPALASQEAFFIRREGAGIDPVTTALIVSFAPVAAKMLADIWEKIIFPKIQRDKGEPLKPKPEE